ncbi:L-2-hydroxyglutarate oxidase [Cellulomonas humilata]|uniref:L-2-hydroxyglutarate oxidase n=1 Tax=Cellulomonas humilata TaxID=144055 RepID=A0ABU0EAS2_9CELL|nr:L-2-hydroxyglutarate oxidase [Cellulomonas humilata]MDQ0371962.1 L-2-hydroxyglutarate oxidase [Cellulomonas humilata]
MHVVVVGAGIVGLAVAARLTGDGHRVTVVEKEQAVAVHQTGRNSGVIHSGLYYTPGSLKARMSVAGQRSMTEYARAHGVDVEIIGKLVVATTPDQVAGLHRLAERARANGVPAQLVGRSGAREREPHVACVDALWVESTGIVDYTGVCRALAAQVSAGEGAVRFGTRVVAATETADGVHLELEHLGTTTELRADAVVACAGLHADRVARACGLDPGARIVPFRGEYFELSATAAELVNGLVYPVPDPRFPFLGVHLTRMVGGGVHAGPNAVLALAREGYTWRDVDLRDTVDALTWPGLWRMGVRNAVPGAREVGRSLSRRAFAHSLAALVPAIVPDDLVPSPAGVRAQAVARDGRLVDDFLLQRTARQVHVLNAPSPAATCALEIAGHVVGQLALS